MKSNNNKQNEAGFKKVKFVKVDIDYLNNYPLNKKECIFLIDLQHNVITFQKGIQNVLGYDSDEVQTSLLSTYCHPDDHELVNNIINASIRFCMNNLGHSSNYKLFISLRLRKKNGNYIKIFCKFSVNEMDEQGRIKSLLAILTDVTFMDIDETVKWNFEASNLDFTQFKNSIYKPYQKVFTLRELEVIKEVCKKIANEQIAENLYISRHTVATHRKNILKKSDCHNVNELMVFCRSIGIDTAEGQ